MPAILVDTSTTGNGTSFAVLDAAAGTIGVRSLTAGEFSTTYAANANLQFSSNSLRRRHGRDGLYVEHGELADLQRHG